jgi:hypothetical protein
MWQRLVLGFILAVAAYYVVRTFNVDSFTNYDSIVETPSYATPVREQMPRGDLNMASGGPNSPNAAAPRNAPATMAPGPAASDPYEVSTDSANAPERLTHPERSFSPGIVPEQSAIAEGAGLTGDLKASAQAFQSFSPEYIQNGGAFFGTVGAFEDENPNYTAF